MTQAARPNAGKGDARTRILEAAEALANELGPGSISIEAVALRAGLSKGGVLYHFPMKAALLSAIVEVHIGRRREAVEAHLAASEQRPNALAEALVEACRHDKSCAAPPASGLLAAIAAHPDFLDPLREHHRDTVGRLRRESGDPDLATVAFLAIEGMKALHLFGFEALTPEEEQAVLGRIAALLRG